MEVIMLSPKSLRRETTFGTGRKFGNSASICHPDLGHRATRIGKPSSTDKICPAAQK